MARFVFVVGLVACATSPPPRVQVDAVKVDAVKVDAVKVDAVKVDAGPRCPDSLPESFSACRDPGLECVYPCPNAPSRKGTVMCAYEERHWVPHYELMGDENGKGPCTD